MNWTYFWIDIATIAGPLALSFDKKVAFFKNYKFFIPAILIPSILYLIWDIIFTRLDIWVFNSKYTLGLYFVNLPWEEIGFFICIPYACLFMYECLRVYFPNISVPRIAKLVAWLVVLLCAVAIYYYPNQIYTSVTAILLMITLLNHLWVTKGDYLTHMLLAWIVAIVPMYIVNGLLTGLPILIYNDTQNTGIRVGTIPIEDFFYNLLYMVWMIWIFERNRQKKSHAENATAN